MKKLKMEDLTERQRDPWHIKVGLPKIWRHCLAAAPDGLPVGHPVSI